MAYRRSRRSSGSSRRGRGRSRGVRGQTRRGNRAFSRRASGGGRGQTIRIVVQNDAGSGGSLPASPAVIAGLKRQLGMTAPRAGKPSTSKF